MKIIIGLGNPGAEYAGTRHNAGIMLVDRIYQSKFMNYEYGFRRKKDIYVYESDTLVLVKTANVFMNESDKLIQELKYTMGAQWSSGNNKFENLYVVHDDLDLKLGEYKIQFGTGPKVHNGILAVERALGTKDFWRVRIGVDNRRERVISGEEYVLKKFLPDERVVVDETLNRAAEELMK